MDSIFQLYKKNQNIMKLRHLLCYSWKLDWLTHEFQENWFHTNKNGVQYISSGVKYYYVTLDCVDIVSVYMLYLTSNTR